MFRTVLAQQLSRPALRRLAKPLAVRTYTSKADSQQLFDRINNFWFGESDKLHDEGKQSVQKWWFEPTEQLDKEIKDKFSAEHAKVIETKEYIDNAKETAEGTLAMIILLDQMGRNMYRGKAEAFRGDEIARSLAMYMVRRKFHEQLRLVKRSFAFMPLMHAEDIEAQDLSVQMYTELEEQLKALDTDAKNNDFVAYSELHRDVIKQFGRFPSRNKALGRESTEEEVEWLKNAPF